MIKERFGKKLKQIRKSKNLTQAELSEITGISEKHISKLESGAYFPTYETFGKLLKALNFDINAIGLDFSHASLKSENLYYLKSLQILNSAKDSTEHEAYYSVLKQLQKTIQAFKG